jgi:hypothetical protein
MFTSLRRTAVTGATAVRNRHASQSNGRHNDQGGSHVLRLLAAAAAGAAALILALPAGASAPPVGPLPKGTVTTVQTDKGSLVAVALPYRSGGKVWRLARGVNAKVLVQVSEATVGRDAVVVYRATGSGLVRLAFGLTRGERSHAYASLTFVIAVR